jgi:transcriptional regulator with XRE-family HTH domain
VTAPATGATVIGGGVLGGRVAGAVLAAIRASMPATQEEMAGRLGVSVTTVQAWERGRKPLVNMPHARLRTLRRSLQAAGASPVLLAVWDRALDADVILAGLAVTDPARHPLALPVTDQAVTELLAWPLSGRPPRQLAGVRASLHAGRGEVAAATAALRRAADQADGHGQRPVTLRHQARLLLAAVTAPPALEGQAA